MSDRKQVLADKTFKGQCDTTQQRVYYTLYEGMPAVAAGIDPKHLSLWLHRTSKLLAHLVEQLEQSGELTEAELDEMLLNVIQ